jgi:hypothetical protein
MGRASLGAVLVLAALGACRDGSSPPARAPAAPPAPPLEAGKDTRALLSDADRARLEGSAELELLTVDPESAYRKQGEPPPDPAEPRFHGYEVLGRAKVTADERRALLTALYGGFDHPEPAAACFIPRHALHAPGSPSLDFLICFECDTVRFYRGDADAVFGGTARAFEPPFDAALKAHSLPRAK